MALLKMLDYFPGKTVRLNKYKHRKCNWITQGILKFIKFKNKLYKDMKLSTPQSKYVQNSFMNCNQNILKTCSIINDILNKTKNKKIRSIFKIFLNNRRNGNR